MKTFDLEAAKRGAAVCTQYGDPARIIGIDMSDPIPISADVEITTRESYYADGTSCEDHFDLMMRDDDYLEKLERGEYGNHIADASKMVETNKFEKHPRLAEYIRTMATTGQLPSDWSGFIAALNEGLATTSDREYWRRAYAGQIAGGLASHNGLNIIGSEIIIAKASCNIADALIAELQKMESDCSKGSRFSGSETDSNP